MGHKEHTLWTTVTAAQQWVLTDAHTDSGVLHSTIHTNSDINRKYLGVSQGALSLWQTDGANQRWNYTCVSYAPLAPPSPPAPSPPPPSPAPPSVDCNDQLRAYTGSTITITCTTTDGSVWGSNPYTDDSKVGGAVTHACGTHRPISVSIVDEGSLSSFASTTNNGITTTPYGSWPAANRIECPG